MNRTFFTFLFILLFTQSQLQALPDLVVTSVWWTPSKPQPGDDVFFHAVLKNIGTSSTPNNVIHAVTFRINGTTVSWASMHRSSMAPGQSVEVTSNNGPNGHKFWKNVPEGTFELTAIADDVNRIAESDETNNIFNTSIIVEYLNGPDLIISSLTSNPPNPTLGDSISLNVTLKNIGNQSIESGSVIQVHCWLNDTMHAIEHQLEDSMTPGNSLLVFTPKKWFIDQRGRYDLHAVVDPDNLISETHDDNNAYNSHFFVDADLVVTDIKMQPPWPSINDTVHFFVSIKNIGTVSTDTAIHDVIIISGGSPISGNFNTLTSIKPGEDTTLYTGRWIVANSGTFEVTARVDYYNRLPESDKANNVYVVNLVVSPADYIFDRYPARAENASSFIESIGVVTHLSYPLEYQKYDEIIKPRLKELGVRHIRDGITEGFYHRYRDLFDDLGIRMIANVGRTPSTAVNRILNVGVDAIYAVEGANEPDLELGSNWPSITRELQIQLHSEIRGNEQTKHLPILVSALAKLSYDMPGGGVGDNTEKIGNIEDYIDYGNLHTYPWYGDPYIVHGNSAFAATLPEEIAHGRNIYGDRPIMVTETGYHDCLHCSSHNKPISRNAESIYLPRLFLHYFNMGVEKTFTYELIDHTPAVPRPEYEQYFGLLEKDGTPKPVFIALRNLISVLQDKSNPFTGHKLEYLIEGNSFYLDNMLLQKGNGDFYLIIWPRTPVFQITSQIDIKGPEPEIRLSFAQPVQKVETIHYTSEIKINESFNEPDAVNISVPPGGVIVRIIPFDYQLKPDLIIDQIEIESQESETGFRVQLKILNAGLNQVNNPFSLVVKANDQLITSLVIDESIPPGGTVKAELILPAVPASDSIQIIVDYFNQVDEADEDNNVEVINTPDFHTSSKTAYYTNELTVFPQPAKDFFYIRYENSYECLAKIRLVNQTGKTVWSEQIAFIELNANNGKRIAADNFPSGIYIMHLITPKGNYTKKIIIIK